MGQYWTPPSNMTMWYIEFSHTSTQPLILSEVILIDVVTSEQHFADTSTTTGVNPDSMNIVGIDLGTRSSNQSIIFSVAQGSGFSFPNPLMVKYRVEGEAAFTTQSLEQGGIE